MASLEVVKMLYGWSIDVDMSFELYDREDLIPCKWVAIDEDGEVYAYLTEPSIKHNNEEWDVTGSNIVFIGNIVGDFLWRESLKYVGPDNDS